MDINIRKSVKNNLATSSHQDIYETIEDAIKVGEEKVLPGLGVLFEVLWQKADSTLRNTIVENISQSLK